MPSINQIRIRGFMATKHSTKAEQWLEKIDHPKGIQGTGQMGINRRSVKRMMEAAEHVLQDASPRCTDIYVFADGSGLWLKRQDDWYPADEDTIAKLLADENDEVDNDEGVEAN
jgi:hypothetical protein